MTNDYSMLANPADVTVLFTPAPCPRPQRLPQKSHLTCPSFSIPTSTLPIQAPNSSQSNSQQPSVTILAFVQPFQALPPYLCPPLQTILAIIAFSPTICQKPYFPGSISFILSQITLANLALDSVLSFPFFNLPFLGLKTIKN
jgi:hypothetical protein